MARASGVDSSAEAPPAPFQSSIHFCASAALASASDAPEAAVLGAAFFSFLSSSPPRVALAAKTPPRSATAARAPELPLSSFFAAFFAAGFAAGLAAGLAAGFAAGADLDADALTAGAVVVLPSVRFLSASASVPAKRDFCSRAGSTCLYMEAASMARALSAPARRRERETAPAAATFAGLDSAEAVTWMGARRAREHGRGVGSVGAQERLSRRIDPLTG